MEPRERAIEVIEHRTPDRIPVYGWLRSNLKDEISEVFGSVENFEDRYEFDLAHIFGGAWPYSDVQLDSLRCAHDGVIEPAHLLEIELRDPNNMSEYLSLHSDGNVSQVLDGIVALGYNVMHPYQESAGMDYQLYLKEYKDHFSILGGLDIQTTLGFGDFDRLKSEIERIAFTFRDCGFIWCTTHYVQKHCSIEELTFAYDLIYNLVRKK